LKPFDRNAESITQIGKDVRQLCGSNFRPFHTRRQSIVSGNCPVCVVDFVFQTHGKKASGNMATVTYGSNVTMGPKSIGQVCSLFARATGLGSQWNVEKRLIYE
jgi:hypothetical protein